MRRSKSIRPSSVAILASSKKIDRPVSNVSRSAGTKRESPKTNTADGGNVKDILSPSFDRSDTPLAPKLSTVTRSSPTRTGGTLAKQMSTVDSSFHLPNNNSASGFVVFTFVIPQFMRKAIASAMKGSNNAQEHALFVERIQRTF
jgi:hypothetical protein